MLQLVTIAAAIKAMVTCAGKGNKSIGVQQKQKKEQMKELASKVMALSCNKFLNACS